MTCQHKKILKTYFWKKDLQIQKYSGKSLEINNRETIAAIDANNDMYCLPKMNRKIPTEMKQNLETVVFCSGGGFLSVIQ